MELFIDIDFLQEFQKGFDANPNNPINEIVKNIVTNYGDKKVFINYDDSNYTILKEKNECFALIANTTVPIPVHSIESVVKKSNLTQTLIFTKKEENWFDEFEKKGALCFSFNNYEQKIKTIIDDLHFKIDLSVPLKNWDFLDAFKIINYNKIAVTDGYILGDNSSQKMEDNIIPILKKITPAKNNNVSISFFTKELKPISEQTKHKKEKAKKRINKFKQLFPNEHIKFNIINSNLNHKISQKFDMHDRTITTNFSIMDSGLGFNLLPHKPSNSQLVSETIFEKYTYKRLNNILSKQSEYTQSISLLGDDVFKIFAE
jgi:hypothetical protein